MRDLNEKPLPKGSWIQLAPLPKDWTDEKLSEFLAGYMVGITAEHCSVRSGRDSSSAWISVPTCAVVELLQWALNRIALVPNREPLQVTMARGALAPMRASR